MEEILSILEKRKKEPTYKRFFRKPIDVINEKPMRLIYISMPIAVTILFIIFFYKMADMEDALLTAVLAAIIPPGFYDFYEKGKISKIDAEFPNLLRDIALSKKAGMTIQAAVSLAAKGEYGKLTAGLKWMDTLLSLGVPFPDVLKHFAEQHPTPMVKRSISIVIEADRIGGEIGNILKTVADDVQETMTLEKKRSSESMPYEVIGYMAFFIFLAIILILYTQFLPMMAQVAEKGIVVGGAIMAKEEDIKLYKGIFFHSLLIEGFCTGIITGKLSEGRVVSGLKHSIVFVVISYLTYAYLSYSVV